MIPEGWKSYKLGEICSKIGSGATPRGGKEAYLVTGEYSLIRSQNILDFSFLKNGLAFISAEQANELRNVTVKRDDVLLNITGDSVARVCQVPDEILPARVNQHVAIIRGNNTIINQKFLKYYLLEPLFKGYMLGMSSSGATRNALTKVMIENFEIKVPDLPTQSRIASILSSLDDKIELNLQMNKTLEAMAQAIFKEWFVDFRFPGFDGELVDGVPKGWRYDKFGELFSISKDSINPSEFPDRVFYHYSIPAFDESRIPIIEPGGAILSNKFIVKPGSILFSKLNPRVPRIWPIGEISQKNAICSTEFVVIQPANTIFYPFIIYCFKMDSTSQRLVGLVTGTSSSHQRIKPLDIKNISVLIPETRLIGQYSEIISPMINRINSNIEENITLRNLRDSLLPKLLTGKIRIPENDLVPK